MISDEEPLITVSDVIFFPALEDDCTICAEEIIGDSTFAYDECSLACTKTDTIGEVCRYTDIINSVRSFGSAIDFTNPVDRDQCCDAGIIGGDPNLQAACDLSGDIPLTCYPTSTERQNDELVYEDENCIQNFRILTYRDVNDERTIESVINDSEITDLD